MDSVATHLTATERGADNLYSLFDSINIVNATKSKLFSTSTLISGTKSTNTILLSSIISFNLATRGCKKSIDDLKASHDAYLKTEEDLQAKKDLNNSTVLTL